MRINPVDFNLVAENSGLIYLNTMRENTGLR